MVDEQIIALPAHEAVLKETIPRDLDNMPINLYTCMMHVIITTEKIYPLGVVCSSTLFCTYKFPTFSPPYYFISSHLIVFNTFASLVELW